MNRPELRAGVVGAGRLGTVHAQIYASMPGVRLAAVCDQDRERARAVASQYGAQAVHEIERIKEDLDVASVAVPTKHHHEIAAYLLRHGIHTLIEKPITETLEQADSLLALAREKGAIVQVGHVERFNPVMRYLESVLDGPRFIEAHRLAPYQPRGTDVGVVLDLMIHDLDVILHLVGQPVVEVHAVGVPVLSGQEDIANARIEFEGGCVANVTASRVSADRLRKIRVFQRDAYVSLDYLAQAGQIYRRTGSEIRAEPVPIEKGEPLRLEIEAFVDAVRSGTQPRVTIEQARAAVALAVRVRRQIRDRLVHERF